MSDLSARSIFLYGQESCITLLLFIGLFVAAEVDDNRGTLCNHLTILRVAIVVGVGNGDDAYVKLCCQLREAYRKVCKDLFLTVFCQASNNILDRLEEDKATTTSLTKEADLLNKIISTLTIREVKLVEVLILGKLNDSLFH